MLKNKKSQGLSITTIIVAVIALIVLVVIVAILTGKLGSFSKGVEQTGDITRICNEQGGFLKAECGDGEDEIVTTICTSGELKSGTECLVCNSGGTDYTKNDNKCESDEYCTGEGSCELISLFGGYVE